MTTRLRLLTRVVLILVLVDHTLGVTDKEYKEIMALIVLILVLVDHTLGESHGFFNLVIMWLEVLILVLVDHTLGAFVDIDGNEQTAESLNPCSSGPYSRSTTDNELSFTKKQS